MADITFEQIKVLVEQMPSEELERLREWINKPTESSPAPQPDTKTGIWGKDLVEMVRQFPLEETDQWPSDHPESWVREYRRTRTSKRNPGWGEE
jgi:hypothetical protein